MRPLTDRRGRDAGFTLPELLISIVLTALVGSVIAMVIVTSMKTAPVVTSRADGAVAVQGLTTWLPPDVDSAVPGQLDVNPAKSSGCIGADVGINLLHLSWDERFNSTTTNYVADYRFVTTAEGGQIVRVSCKGSPSLGAPSTLTMSGKLSTTVPTVIPIDTNSDGLNDQVTFKIETLSGEIAYIDAATKNPDETLPPNKTSYTTTTAPNASPIAGDISLNVNPSAPITFVLPASDPDGDTLTAILGTLPVGWTASVIGLQVTLTPNATTSTIEIQYRVVDPSGLDDGGVIKVVVSSSPTTTIGPATTTTTIPPCVIANIIVENSPVRLSANGTGKLKTDVVVTVVVESGYCVGLTLEYETNGPNAEHSQNLGDAAPYQVRLLSHPQGTELWTTGNKSLNVYQVVGTTRQLLGTALLQVTN